MMLATVPTKAMLKRIEKLKRDITKRRDALRDLVDEMEQLCENCDTATDHLTSAADALSELL